MTGTVQDPFNWAANRPLYEWRAPGEADYAVVLKDKAADVDDFRKQLFAWISLTKWDHGEIKGGFGADELDGKKHVHLRATEKGIADLKATFSDKIEEAVPMTQRMIQARTLTFTP